MSVDASSLERRPTTFADGSEGREYYHPDITGGFPSVTTVLNSRIDPDKEDGLEWWRKSYDGSEPAKSPHWLAQRRFKAYRGTLVHFAVAKQLDSDQEQTDEEFEALEHLKNWWAYRPQAYDWFPVEEEDEIPDDAFEEPACPEEVYETVSRYHHLVRNGATHDEALNDLDDVSIEERKWAAKTSNQHDGQDAYLRAMKDVSWAQDAFDTAREQMDIAEVVGIEKYVIDEEWKYAGQFDLLYRDSDDNLVVGDLKTSSKLRYSHRIQTAAYANALDEDVDKLVVFRLYPDYKDIEVSFDDEWEMSKDGLTSEFLYLCEKTQTQVLGNDVDDKGVFYP